MTTALRLDDFRTLPCSLLVPLFPCSLGPQYLFPCSLVPLFPCSLVPLFPWPLFPCSLVPFRTLPCSLGPQYSFLIRLIEDPSTFRCLGNFTKTVQKPYKNYSKTLQKPFKNHIKHIGNFIAGNGAG